MNQKENNCFAVICWHSGLIKLHDMKWFWLKRSIKRKRRETRWLSVAGWSACGSCLRKWVLFEDWFLSLSIWLRRLSPFVLGAKAFLKFGAEQLSQPSSCLRANPETHWPILVKFPRPFCVAWDGGSEALGRDWISNHRISVGSS